jgi:hypothetical protein
MPLTDCRCLAAGALLILAGCGGTNPADTTSNPASGVTPATIQATVQKLTVADLQAADADAKAHNDTVAGTCYEALIPLVQSQESLLPGALPKGAVSAFQAARDIANGVQSGPSVLKGLNVPCAPLVLDAENTLIQLGLRIGGTAGIAAGLPPLPVLP